MKRNLESSFTLEAFRHLVKVSFIGVTNTVAAFATFTSPPHPAPDLPAHRRPVSGSETRRASAANLVAWDLTTLLVNGANALQGPLNRTEANLAFLAAAVIIIIPEFAGYRDIVF